MDNALLQEMTRQARDIMDNAWKELDIEVEQPAPKVAQALAAPTE
jgi:hypothetical protein